MAHTYAAFVKAVRNSAGSGKILETHTISWMPESLVVRLLARPEPGVNLDLKASLQLGNRTRAGITMWGPYEIKKELFDRAVQQESRLKRGAIAYKAIDRRFRPGSASNCIHALSDIDMDNGLLDTATAHGDEASYMVLRHLQRWIVHAETVHGWVSTALGLDKYRLVAGRLSNPSEVGEP